MNALGKVPTLLGTVINITISEWLGQEAGDMVSRKGAKERAWRKERFWRLCVFLCDFA
jgi:hypothetical protein